MHSSFRRAARCRRTVGVCLSGIALVGIAGSALAYPGEQLAKQAKIGLFEARSIALKAHSGKITDQELERESGGSGLRYSFDIVAGTAEYEVGIDAQTGAVLENVVEGATHD